MPGPAFLAPAGRLALLPDPRVLPASDAIGLAPALLGLGPAGPEGTGRTWLRVYRPAQTVAFSHRDRVGPGYAAAVTAARARGWCPVLRAPGGRAVAYHEDALCLEFAAGQPDPGRALDDRFAALARVVTAALAALGADARTGPVPGEACPGQYSVNLSGRWKVMGSAQRVTRAGWFLGASLIVGRPEPVRDVLADVYRHLGLPFDPGSAGALSSALPGIQVGDVRTALLRALAREADLVPTPWPDAVDPYRDGPPAAGPAAAGRAGGRTR